MDSVAMLNKLSETSTITSHSDRGAGVLEATGGSFSPLADDAVDGSLSVEVVQDTQAFDKLENEWSNLVENATTHVFQTYEWQRLWWKHFGARRRLHIVLFRQNGILVGIAPFFLDTSKALGLTLFSNLYLLGSDVMNASSESTFGEYSPSDYLDLITLPGFEKSITATLLRHFDETGDLFDRIVLKELPEDSILMRFLVPRLDGSGWSPKVSRGDICPRLHIPDTLDEFKRSLHSKVRYQLFQTKRAVTEQGLFSLEAALSQEVLDRSFSEFVGLHQRRWNRLGYPGSFANERYREFLHDVTRAFLQRGWLWFRTARNDGRCIAAQCAFKFKDYMYDYLKAFDHESPEAKRRPGRALLLSLIEESIQEKIRVVDFLRGAEKYKFELTPDAQFNWNVVIRNPNEASGPLLQIRRLLSFLMVLRRKLSKEAVLIRVHAKEWGFPRFATPYALFMWKRVREAAQPKHPKKSDSTSLAGTELKVEGTLELEVISDASKFHSLRDEWDRLVEASSATIFQTFDWQWLWWKYFGDRLHLHIILFRRGGKLVGIAPLYLDVHSVFGLKLYRRLRFLGGGVEDRRSQWDLAQFGPSDYLDVFALPEFRVDVARSFLAYLRKETWLDEAELENIPHDSLLVKDLIPFVKEEGHPYRYVQDHVCPRITLPSTLEEYLRTRSAKFRYQLSQTRKATTKQGLFSIEPVQSKNDLSSALSELIRLHQMRWNRIGYPGVFADSRFQRFQEEVTARFLEKGWLWFKTVRMNGSCIAARLGFKFKDSISDYIAGFDDRSPGAKRRPGFALILSMMEDALQNKMRTVDLLRGYETYKFVFTDEILNDWKIVIPNPASARTFRARVHRATHYLEFLLRKMHFESSMFKVHFREHGFPKFLVRYSAFRVKKLSEKIVNELKMAKLISDDH
jgi:CelD/BcsL family acetyltransferase involved in cellulose biosynthesis